MWLLRFALLLLALPDWTTAQTLPTLAQFLGNDTELSTWSAVLSSSGYNISSLSNATFFAPTNAAFDKLDATFLAKLLQPGWSKHLENVLLMHISTLGALDSSQLTDGAEIFALNTESLLVSIDNGNISMASPNTNNSVVVQADIGVVEGIVHKVDQVLLPRFVSTSLLDLADVDGFSIWTELLTVTGWSNVVGSDVVATFFAPTDDAFKALKNGTLEYYRANIDIATILLAGHVISNVVLPTSDMVVGPIPNQTAGGTFLTVTVEEFAGTVVYQIDNATIGTPDVLANNGIVHGISEVIAVPGTEYPPVSISTSPASMPVSNKIPTFVDYLANDTELSTFYEVISSVGYSIRTAYSVTVFAPTNYAFDSLDEGLLNKLLQPGWSEHLANALLMHFSTSATLTSSQLVDGEEIVASNAERLSVSIDAGNVSISSPNTNHSGIVKLDIAVVEGIAHKVDHVLLPQFVSKNLLDFFSGYRFSIWTELLTVSGLLYVVGSDVVMTAFAPTDEVFNALGQEALDYYRANIDVVTNLIAGHVITEVVLPIIDMVEGQIPNKTAAATYLNVTIEESGGTKLYRINDASITIQNVLANNGIIHGIDAILAVPGTEYPRGSQTNASTAPLPETVPIASSVQPTGAPSVASNATTAPVSNNSRSSSPAIGAVIGGVAGGLIILAIAYLVKLRWKTNDDFHRRASMSPGDESMSMESPVSDNSVVPSVLAAPIMGGTPYATAPVPDNEADAHRVLYKDQCRPASAPRIPPIPDAENDDHQVSYKDQCRPSIQPAAMPPRVGGEPPVVRVSDTVIDAVNRGDSIPFAVAVEVPPSSKDHRYERFSA